MLPCLSCGESSECGSLEDELQSSHGGEESLAGSWNASPASSLSSCSSSLSVSTVLEDLSTMTAVLSADIYEEIQRRECELARLGDLGLAIDPRYHHTRPILVDWMLDVGDYFEFDGATTHLAIAYLDRMLASSDMSIERSRLQLVATTCLLIAAKLEEVPEKVPTLSELNARTMNTYKEEQIRTCERIVLNHLDWSLCITTPRSILDFFLAEIPCVSYDDLIQGVPLSYDRSQAVEEWTIASAHSVMTMIVLDHQFLQFRPSILAAVCLAVARKQACIEPLWSPQLERKTRFTFDDLAECFYFTWTKRGTQSGPMLRTR